MTRIFCWFTMVLMVAFAWQAIEVNLYGYSQQSIVDTFAGFYIAYRLACWATEETEDFRHDDAGR